MLKPSRRTRTSLVALAGALAVLGFVWWEEVSLWLPSRQLARVEALRAAFERDFESLPREERSRRYRELIEAEKNLPDARRRAYSWDRARERHLDYVAMLRRFAAMAPDEKTKALDHAIDETRDTLKRSEEAIKQAKASGVKPPSAEPVEAGSSIVWTGDEIQLRDNYSRALRDRKAQRAKEGR